IVVAHRDIEINNDRHVVGWHGALSLFAMDGGPRHCVGERCGTENEINAHTLVAREPQLPIVPVREPGGNPRASEPATAKNPGAGPGRPPAATPPLTPRRLKTKNPPPAGGATRGS